MEIEVEIQESFYDKVSEEWQDVISESLNEIAKQAYNYIMEPGVGVADGHGKGTPSGGAPVGKYPKGSGKTGGTLRTGHQLNLNARLSKQITNQVEYAPYVINGTSKMNPNNYPLRAFQKLETSGDAEKIVQLVFKRHTGE